MSDETAFRDALAQHAELARGREEILAALRDPLPRRNRKPLGVAAAAIAVAGAAGIGLTALMSPPAYAVTRHPDGSVTVTINDIKAVDPANEKLRELGVRARAVPMTADCADIDGTRTYQGADWDFPSFSGNTVTLPARIPEGHTVLLSVTDLPDRGTGLGITVPIEDPAPSCVLDPARR
ncbi:hypothetical protein AB0I60_10160 [Actinosynnema sp. NPDC050436]|uniref:hypothetical protein n=1 Tax=Actinosynnema sp. NPDC050436 TaxID=3155659 RepID=UPI0033D812AF